MLVRFTPKQIQKLKEFLKTVRLNAYDIPLYNEILLGLDNAIDEKISHTDYNRPKYRKEVYNRRSDTINNISNPINPVDPSIVNKTEDTDIVEDNLNNNDSFTENINIEPINDSIEKTITDITTDNCPQYIEDTNEDISNKTNNNVEGIPPFGIIDRRTKKGNKSDYI